MISLPSSEVLMSLVEMSHGLLDKETVAQGISSGRYVVLKGSRRNILVGGDALIKIATAIGVSTPREYGDQCNKLDAMIHCDSPPDIIMDLSILKLRRPLYQEILDRFDGVAATVPVYYCFHDQKGIDVNEILDEIEEEAESGVGYINLHLTANLNYTIEHVRPERSQSHLEEVDFC